VNRIAMKNTHVVILRAPIGEVKIPWGGIPIMSLSRRLGAGSEFRSLTYTPYLDNETIGAGRKRLATFQSAFGARRTDKLILFAQHRDRIDPEGAPCRYKTCSECDEDQQRNYTCHHQRIKRPNGINLTCDSFS